MQKKQQSGHGGVKMLEIKPMELIKLDEAHSIQVIRVHVENWPLHGHSFFEIELVVKGLGKGIINGKEVVLKPGRIHLLTTADFHEMQWETPKEETEMICVRIDKSVLHFEIIEKIFQANQVLSFQLDQREYRQIYHMLEAAWDMDGQNIGVKNIGALQEACIVHLIEAVIILLLQKVPTFQEERQAEKEHVFKAIAYLEMNFSKKPTLEEVSAFVGLNKNYFSTLFHKETGKTFVQYINNLKLRYAKNLLKSTKMPVNEICYASGFHSFSTFMHEFKKKYKETPMKYRKRKNVSQEV